MSKENENTSSNDKNKNQDSSKEQNLENKQNEENIQSNSDKSLNNPKNKEEDSKIPHPLPLKLNKVKNRLLFLSPTVRTGLERECNKNDFFREGDSYIGKGAFGEVWKVSHRQSNKIYVIKVMDKAAITDQNLSDQRDNYIHYLEDKLGLIKELQHNI